MCPELMEKIFLYLLESNPHYCQSNQNKRLYSNFRLVCKDWCNVACADILWKPRILALHFACQGNYLNALKKYGKALYESKLDILEEKWYANYKLQVEIVNCTTGELLYYTFGYIEVEVLNEKETRLGIKNDSVFVNSPSMKTNNLQDYLKEIRVRIIAHNNDKFAVLYDVTGPILVSARQIGGYFKLPNNTFFCSTKKIQYIMNEYKAYVCFDLIKNENCVEFHRSTQILDKYSSSLAYLINCSVEDLGIFFKNLNWKM
jgi:hypothetical protein